ncbi:potassium channel family protein [Anaerobranca gottschalkii]|uniref:Voltage-gated potassium channel n=1 Tax=Anaerobranca gottschalkii DSM 13577 TaxID=1120990 RepID=A0A1I0AIJ7_9FIRM|nr:potassium channel protein [Anaerobranca gottschalkii]SES94123.1 voltage-gated potassium channel [Anaerobranca gottschalkii DSM 13577]
MNIIEKKRFYFIVFLLLTFIFLATIGYSYLLDVSLIDALYMTVITISTVGYGEVAEMTPTAKLFSIFVIFSGLGMVGYIFTSIGAYLIEGIFNEMWRKRQMQRKIEQLKDHYILCGAGDTGESVITEFQKAKVPFIVIDRREEKVNELIKEGVLALQGDATHEDDLAKCRIKWAKGLISTLATDADNVFTVLTAREMNPDLYIISRAIEKNSRQKLIRAGANNTISPNEIEGKRMAALLLKPTIISFLDIITHAGDVELDLEDVIICCDSQLAGTKLKDAKIPEKTGLIVLAIKKGAENQLHFNPSPNDVLNPGDVMVVLGREEQIGKLREIAGDTGERNPGNFFIKCSK